MNIWTPFTDFFLGGGVEEVGRTTQEIFLPMFHENKRQRNLLKGAARNSPESAISCSISMRPWLMLRYSFLCKSNSFCFCTAVCTTLWISESLLSDASFRFVISGMMWTQCTKCHYCLLTWQCQQIKPYVTLQVLLLAVAVQAKDLSPPSQLPVT